MLKTNQLFKLNNSFSPKNTTALAKKYPIEKIYKEKLKSTGKTKVGVCPFHSEKTPSFVVYSETNTFHCFGCQETGDVIDLYMKLNNVSFKGALEALAQ